MLRLCLSAVFDIVDVICRGIKFHSHVEQLLMLITPCPRSGRSLERSDMLGWHRSTVNSTQCTRCTTGQFSMPEQDNLKFYPLCYRQPMQLAQCRCDVASFLSAINKAWRPFSTFFSRGIYFPGSLENSAFPTSRLLATKRMYEVFHRFRCQITSASCNVALVENCRSACTSYMCLQPDLGIKLHTKITHVMRCNDKTITIHQ